MDLEFRRQQRGFELKLAAACAVICAALLLPGYGVEAIVCGIAAIMFFIGRGFGGDG